FGDVTVTLGAIVSPARRVTHIVAFWKSRLSRPAASPHPSKMLLLPGAADPSSIGELSPAKKTRPLPYTECAAITPVVPCERPFIQMSPFTVALTAGYSVKVVPL